RTPPWTQQRTCSVSARSPPDSSRDRGPEARYSSAQVVDPRACCEGGAAVYVPSRPFFSKNTQSADRALPRGPNQEPVGLSRGSEERPGFAGAFRTSGGSGPLRG